MVVIELERRLGSVEDYLAEVARTIKESETRTHLRMLQLENRLLSGILTTNNNRGNSMPTAAVSNSYPSPDKSANPSPPVYDDDTLGQTSSFAYAKTLASNDSSQRSFVPPENDGDHDTGFPSSSKRRCLSYQHEREAPMPERSPVVSAGSITCQATASSVANLPVYWNLESFDYGDISAVDNPSAVLNGFDFSSVLEELIRGQHAVTGPASTSH
ncbi:hypothetical protein SPI_02373 [Niveomyces insectorum RCEF 264]|uniref:Uncharacterized protein n=1 Tax=Niveomyces insectorum RCEF 264 TaxID=1081102 RepID=A0A167XYL8_9HYPO|nr:hypothetical protein SPI_02373 [Niveomyces insectorum RCEF 264]